MGSIPIKEQAKNPFKTLIAVVFILALPFWYSIATSKIATTTPTTNNTVGNAAKDATIKETVKGNVLKAGKESIKISIKKIAKAKGYQVQVSTSKKFKKKVTITKLTKKNSIVIKKLKKKKQYFVRTRSYTIVKKKFGKWSKVKAIKTK